MSLRALVWGEHFGTPWVTISWLLPPGGGHLQFLFPPTSRETSFPGGCVQVCPRTEADFVSAPLPPQKRGSWNRAGNKTVSQAPTSLSSLFPDNSIIWPLKAKENTEGGKRVRFQQRNHRPQWHLCFQIFCPVVRPWVSTLDLETMEVVNIVSGKELAGKGRLSERKPPKFKEIWDVERQIWGCFLLYYVSGIGKVELLLACILSWREIKE